MGRFFQLSYFCVCVCTVLVWSRYLPFCLFFFSTSHEATVFFFYVCVPFVATPTSSFYCSACWRICECMLVSACLKRLLSTYSTRRCACLSLPWLFFVCFAFLPVVFSISPSMSKMLLFSPFSILFRHWNPWVWGNRSPFIFSFTPYDSQHTHTHMHASTVSVICARVAVVNLSPPFFPFFCCFWSRLRCSAVFSRHRCAMALVILLLLLLILLCVLLFALFTSSLEEFWSYKDT